MRRKARPGGGRQVELVVESLGARGDGVAELDGRPVFLPMALPGERVTARISGTRGGGYKAEVVELQEAAPVRIDPPCPHFGPCGGCTVQHLDPGCYSDWKRGIVVQALERRGFSADLVGPLQKIAPGTRRRIALSAVMTERGLRLGLNARDSHHVVALETCLLATPRLVALLRPLRDVLERTLPRRSRAEVTVTESDTGADILVACDGSLDLSAREAWTVFAEAEDIARLSWSRGDEEPEPVVLRRAPIVTFGKVPVELPAGGFLQPSREGQELLTALVLGYLPADAETVADLFAGSGTFSFPLASRARVHAVEGDAAALSALWAAARKADLANRVTVEQRDLFRRPVTADELTGGDCVVFDPPRAGAKEQAGELAASTVRTVIAVSCNPNSFGRDARILVEGGYDLLEVQPLDQFPWSGHVELVGLFRRT